MQCVHFEAQVDLWIREAIARGIEDFGSLTRALHGLSPPEVARALRRIDDLPPQLRDLPPATDLLHGPYTGLVPHPLDFDWRFSSAALDDLFSHFRRLGGSDPAVALLGAPSVFRRALLMGWPTRV
jgi:hypothetical protein